MKRQCIQAGLAALVLLGLCSCERVRHRWRRPGPEDRVFIPVFALHRVVPGQATEYVMSPERLEELLLGLKKRRFTPISLAQLDAALRSGGRLPKRPALLTFDDAYLDNHEHALPVLRRHRWPAVFFVPVGKITDPPAERVSWGDGPDPVAMQWPEVLAMKQAGMEIGSHAYHHVNLAKAEPDVVREELEESRRMLTERVGAAPLALAYPGGRHHAEVRAAAETAGYRLGFLSGGGPIPMGIKDMFALPRVHVPGYVDAEAVLNSLPRNEWR